MILEAPMVNPDSYPTWKEALLAMAGVIGVCSIIAWALTERMGNRFDTFLEDQSKRDAERDGAFAAFAASQQQAALHAAETRGATQARMEFLERSIAAVGADVKALLHRHGRDDDDSRG